MSATGRMRVLSDPLAPPSGCEYPEGSTLRVVTRTKRRKGDFYETPAWLVEAILPYLPLDTAALVVDAGAGNGAISAAVASKFPQLEILGVEKDDDLLAAARARQIYAAEFVQADWEQWDVGERVRPDVVIMNPPYSRAREFIEHAFEVVKRGGTVAALLRIAWLSGMDRIPFHREHAADVYVSPRRPSFTGDGGTDMTEYAWFVWNTNSQRRWEVLRVPAKGKRRRG